MPIRSGERVRDALIRAARRGVLVRVLIDGVGSRAFPADWLDTLKSADVSVLIYRPVVSGWLSNPYNLRRLHRKLAVIDARIAFVGGMNLIDDQEPTRFDLPRLDFSVEVQGPLLARIHQSVRRLWQLVALSQLQARDTQGAARAHLADRRPRARGLRGARQLCPSARHRACLPRRAGDGA